MGEFVDMHSIGCVVVRGGNYGMTTKKMDMI